MAGSRHDNDRYVSHVENSLVEMERRISDIMPSTPSRVALISSPSVVDNNYPDGRNGKNNTFRRGASSINFQASELKRPSRKKRLSNWGLTFLILALVQGETSMACLSPNVWVDLSIIHQLYIVYTYLSFCFPCVRDKYLRFTILGMFLILSHFINSSVCQLVYVIHSFGILFHRGNNCRFTDYNSDCRRFSGR